MKRTLLKIATIGAIAAGMAFAQTTTPAPAQTQKAMGIKARIQRRLIQALNLTDAQKQQAKQIRQTTKQQAQPLAQQLREQRQALNAAVQAGDTAKIPTLSASVGSLQGQVLAIRATGQAQFIAILTPEQKAKAAEFRQKARQVLGGKG